MSEVVVFPGETLLPLPAERVLNGALEAGLGMALVLGRYPDGQIYLATTHGDLGDLLLLLERAKAAFLEDC